jgi:hypothetical protein
MNVFYLDDDPVTAAAWLCDQHVSKMILESAQMMCTAIRMHMGLEDTPREELPEELKFLYKKAHPKHGSTIWVGECFRNFQWLFSHVVQMHSQHKHRFGTRHKSFRVAREAWFFLVNKRAEHKFILPERNNKITPPYMAFGPELEHLKDPSDPVGSYRKFYVADKAKFATWTNSEPPHWWPKEKC